jgi:hypothetical protein
MTPGGMGGRDHLGIGGRHHSVRRATSFRNWGRLPQESAYEEPPPLRRWLRDCETSLYAATLALIVEPDDGGLHWIAHKGSAWLCDGLTTGGRWLWRERRLPPWSVKAAYAVEREP